MPYARQHTCKTHIKNLNYYIFTPFKNILTLGPAPCAQSTTQPLACLQMFLQPQALGSHSITCQLCPWICNAARLPGVKKESETHPQGSMETIYTQEIQSPFQALYYFKREIQNFTDRVWYGCTTHDCPMLGCHRKQESISPDATSIIAHPVSRVFLRCTTARLRSHFSTFLHQFSSIGKAKWKQQALTQCIFWEVFGDFLEERKCCAQLPTRQIMEAWESR